MPAHPDDPCLPDELIELVAARLAALGDPKRVRLLDALRRRGEMSVGELATEAGAGYANAAKHLSLLHRERILSRRKQGSKVLYRISDQSVLAICELVCGSLAAQVRELAQLIGDTDREVISEEVQDDFSADHARRSWLRVLPDR
jgi:DNA-binding transcriptional ArsR family regulator